MARDDLGSSFRYLVELDGVPRAAFGYCAGLEEATYPVEYYVSDDALDLGDMAALEHEAHLILAQGVAFDGAVDAWQREAAEGHAELHDGTITEFDGRGRARRRFHFSGGRPSFYQGIRVVGSPSRHIDTLEIACDTLTRN